MGAASNSQVLSATRQWLKPMIHVLIRCGITWKDFAALAAKLIAAAQRAGRMNRRIGTRAARYYARTRGPSGRA